MRQFFFALVAFFPLLAAGQACDTLNGFETKIAGEGIVYYSPYQQFANTAMLTRAKGNMPISWKAPVYGGKKKAVCYELLIGHSTGTSKGVRHFDVFLNDQLVFTFTTQPQLTGHFENNGTFGKKGAYHFSLMNYDSNGDAFGKLYITLPPALVAEKADFRIVGRDDQSNDWLMVFEYQRQFRIDTYVSSLVTRKTNKRVLNILVENPYNTSRPLVITSKHFTVNQAIPPGYSSINVDSYPADFTGADEVLFRFNGEKEFKKDFLLDSLKHYQFHIIHHSHNDIGYSHLQTEVERIQNNNIRAAISWVEKNNTSGQQPVWHIESLWAVENFLKVASAEEHAKFLQYVKEGHIVLSANYANILTGICQSEELDWMVEYAQQLEKMYGLQINTAMITDIPGITWAGLNTYARNDIPYLSLGPNYVEAYPDRGDRVGGIIREQGDKVFYWKPNPQSEKKVLVWTAGKGYSFFHSVSEADKQIKWEKKISAYCAELVQKNYPYELVQLRYTKHADNGPVDSNLCTFVANWNRQYSSPQLIVSSLETLFPAFEARYGSQIPTLTGELSPYWEDGAYSTAAEEFRNRELSLKTIALEEKAKQHPAYAKYQSRFYHLHKNIVLFHEHTWGAHCSISEPESFFTQEQWRLKKQYGDSAELIYLELAALFGEPETPLISAPKSTTPVTDFVIDPVHGGLRSLIVNSKDVLSGLKDQKLFEPVYSLGINPSVVHSPEKVQITLLENTLEKKRCRVSLTLRNMRSVEMIYTLDKKQGKLTCAYTLDKVLEKDKESFHIALPNFLANSAVYYGSTDTLLNLQNAQLPGSNYDFLCAEDRVTLQNSDLAVNYYSPDISLYEIGSLIDETRSNGAKTWRKSPADSNDLFLYVFNNYWHTNYKAYQEGKMAFTIEMTIDAVKK